MTVTCFHAYVDNTNIITVSGVASLVTGELIDDAALTLTVLDKDGEEVAGQTWPWTMPPVVGQAGTYRGIIKDTVALVAGQTYTAVIEANAGPDLIAHWEFVFTPETRRGE